MPFDFAKADRLRRERGLTMQQAAERAGIVSRQRWHQLIRRPGDVALSTLERVAKALDVTPADLITTN